MDNKQRQDINSRVCNRNQCFYWQTDRQLSAEETALIWKDRHSAIINEELLEKVNSELRDVKLASIKPFDEQSQTSLGNVNSIRIGVLTNGQEVLIRCHPKGLKNGYFNTESLASNTALKYGIPGYKTYLIHELTDELNISYQVIEKLAGDTIQYFLKTNPDKEKAMVYEMGRTMAKLHKIKVNGFGPFDNEKAKKGELIGIHKSLSDSINAGLEENLNRLVGYKLFSQEVA